MWLSEIRLGDVLRQHFGVVAISLDGPGVAWNPVLHDPLRALVDRAREEDPPRLLVDALPEVRLGWKLALPEPHHPKTVEVLQRRCEAGRRDHGVDLVNPAVI